MFGLIKSSLRLAFMVTTYAAIVIHLAGWATAVVPFILVSGVSELVLTSIICAASTLGWIFTPELVEIAVFIWLLLPMIKLAFYLGHKAVSV